METIFVFLNILNVSLLKTVAQEKQTVLDFEQLSHELSTERQRLEMTLETKQSYAERRIEELVAENQQLMKTTETLRERAKIDGDAKIKAIEKENKVIKFFLLCL